MSYDVDNVALTVHLPHGSRGIVLTRAIERAAKTLEAEVDRRCEWYGLDNWSFEDVARWVFEKGLGL